MINPDPAPRLAPDLPVDGTGNESSVLVPVHGTGAGTVEYDFRGVEIGTAEYAEGPTGATVISIPAGARTAVDQRGGAVGLSGGFPYSEAICLTGGSTYGLAAGTGVTDEMLVRKRNATGFDTLPAVSTAVIYDFGVRANAIHPDAALGRAAFRAAVHGRVPFGRVGAGISASVGKISRGCAEFAGQGVAFVQIGDVRILAVTVVNAVGVVVDRSGTVVRGNYDAATGTRRHPYNDTVDAFTVHRLPPITAGNTTISVVVTNVAMDDRDLTQFARQVHSSMHRAIQPFQTALDGDVLFAVTTDELLLPSPAVAGVTPTALGTLAAETMWDAVLRSVV